MPYTSEQALELLADLVVDQHGEPASFTHIAPPENATAQSLVCVEDNSADLSQASVLVTTVAQMEKLADQHQAFLIAVINVRLALASLKRVFDEYQHQDLEWPDIHPAAVVHKSAQLGLGCRVGPNAVVGAHCVLGQNVVIRAGAVVEHSCKIGAGSTINPNANIGYGSELGERVIVKSGAVIASEGFGFATDSQRKYHRIPHTGIVVLEDDVHIGANTCIDRATFGETRLKAGVKIDNLVHIAHNVEIGEDSVLIAQVGIAGSTRLGKRVISSGQTGILDHKTIADDVVLVHRAAVIEDIEQAGMYGGNPLQPFREHMQKRRYAKRLSKLEKQLAELQKRFDQKESDVE